jgi:hypothetical protein
MYGSAIQSSSKKCGKDGNQTIKQGTRSFKKWTTLNSLREN